MIDLPTFRDLLSPEGQALLAAATALRPTEAGFLGCFEKLRKCGRPEVVKAALETVLLRDRAKAKFSRADCMYFTREAVEQASGEAISRYRATRFQPFPRALDLCCGIGVDTIFLALSGGAVEGCDVDPLRLAMAAQNLLAYGASDRARLNHADVTMAPLPEADAAFVDPSRREGERRVLSPNQYQPPLGSVLERFPVGFPLAAKIAPGVARADLASWDAEAEWISVDGELKECVLWFGPFRTAARRATVLPGAHTLTDSEPSSDAPPTAPEKFVFDPGPAVIRADLLGQLAGILGAAPLEYGVAMLTGPEPVGSPFADCYRVEHAAPFHRGNLRDYLRQHSVGRVTILKRAVDLDVNLVNRGLKLTGSEHRHLILTRSGGRTVGIVAESVEMSHSPPRVPTSR